MATMVLTTAKTNVSFILLGSGTAEVNWGEQIKKSYSLSSNQNDFGNECTCTYPNSGTHTITISGDNITELHCSSNSLTSLDVSQNPMLQRIDCHNNELKTLNLSKNNVLQSLNCTENRMDAAALNSLLSSLNSNPGKKSLTIKGNPGESGCNIKTATDKFWSVDVDSATTDPFSMTIDDVFTISGRGTVATGRITTGVLNAGDAVEISGLAKKITSVVFQMEINGKVSNSAKMGDDVCLFLKGIPKSAISKGLVIRHPAATLPSQPASSALQELQMDLYIKLANTDDHSYDQLKKKIQDKKLKPSERLSKEELQMAKDYFLDYQKYPNALPAIWHPQYRLERFESWFKPEVIERLLKLTDMQQLTGTSLIPIKGISKVMQAKLRSLYIYDVAGLLVKGKTQEKRNHLAKTLDADVRLVNSWVKQADLWQVDGMTTDMAYLLVQIGVRHVEDLSKIDADKAYPIMQRLVLAQPDFIVTDSARLNAMIEEAKEYAGLPRRSRIETLEEEPEYLFREDVKATDPKSDGKIIKDGLGFLDDLPRVLPLPNYLAGAVYRRMRAERDEEKTPFNDILVEISGVTSSTADKTEADKIPSAYTDSEGNFRIILPEKLNLQEGIVITVSQGSSKQKFIKNASDIINAVPEQELMNKFDILQAIKYFIEAKDAESKELAMMKSNLAIVTAQLKDDNISPKDRADLTEQESELKRKIKNLEDNCKDIEREIRDQKKECEKIRKEILAYDKTTNDLEKIFQNLLNKENLTANIGALTVVEEIFKGYPDIKKALPSVKLMGEGEKAIHLPTDTAPSRVFNYGMLQRLVEPEIKGENITVRKKLNTQVDVMNFKERMYLDPDSYPQMSSLGIGYVLNMHQAWVPDGFALGSLLYSLILAPGEEQRLVVRENTQSYTVSDDAQGMDSDHQTYELSQTDDTTAAYNYALNQLSKANSGYNYEASTNSFGGGYGGAVGFNWGGFLNLGSAHGFSGAWSKSKGSGSASASQSNAHNEASSAAQTFQHSIKSAADRISQSKRISVRTAASEESNSVATKIIANHNHSHAMTIQYWEVMRRFRLETCVDGVDLVLFVPLRLIRFLPSGQNYMLDYSSSTTFNRSMFNARYNVLLQYADTLSAALPNQYRTGLSLIKKYAALPNWMMEKIGSGVKTLTMKFKACLLSFDDVTVALYLKNGKGVIAGDINYSRQNLPSTYKTTEELKQAIRYIRNRSFNLYVVECTFSIPSDINEDDLSHIRIDYSCEGLVYELYKDTLSESEEKAYNKMLDKMYDLAKDDRGSKNDRQEISHFKSQLPEAYRAPIVTLTSKTLMDLGAPTISAVDMKLNNVSLGAMLSSSTLRSSVTINIANDTPVLRYAELQEMEAAMHHMASHALPYSQVVWASLSEDERAVMLEQYTIDMNFDDLPKDEQGEIIANTSKKGIDIPLLNCVNVKKLLGFYGNCILLPFTYPKELAEELGKTAADVQDALYRYHTHCFRVPTTTVSLPTDGMIGEAVLGETNVSELIDLTRFWNWKDSPIDKMEINSDYLNNTDYLADKTTQEISALNVQGATPAVAEKMVDLISALVSKQTPSFENITGLSQLQDVLNKGTDSAGKGRDKVLDTTAKLAELSVEILNGKKAAAKTDTSKTDSANEDKIKAILDKAVAAKNVEEVNKLKEECEKSGATQDQVKTVIEKYYKDKTEHKEKLDAVLGLFKKADKPADTPAK